MCWYVYRFQLKIGELTYRETRSIMGKCILEAILNAQTKLMLEFGTSDVNIFYIRELHHDN